MRLPSVRGFDRSTLHHRDGRRTHHVTLYRQPLHRWLAARAYHWYDMRVYKVPGFKLLENIKEWRYRNRDWYVPISAEQDCRCYDLGERDKTVLATIEVPADVYQQMTGKSPP